MDNTTLLVMTTAKSLYQDDRNKRVNFGTDAGPVVTFEAVKPENAQYVHDACVKLGHKCSCAPGTHDQPATFEKEKTEAKRIDDLLSASPLGKAALADRKAKEAAEAAKFAANQEKPTDRYLRMTPAGLASLTYRKNGGKS